MSIVKTLMGRRQFLVAAGVASTCALTCKKLAGFQTGVAMAADKAAGAGIKAAGNKCPYLLSPLRIRDVVLKNRIMHTVSPTYFMQGPENFPAEMYRNHYSNMAKNAAIVSMSTHYGTYPKTYVKGQHGPSANFCDDIWQDIPPVENYVDRLIEDIHCEGALILFVGNTGGQGNLGMPGGGIVPGQAGASGASQQGAPGAQGGMPGAAGAQGGMPSGMPGAAGGQGGMPGGQQGTASAQGGRSGGMPGMSSKTDDEIVAEAKTAEERGYDVYQLNSSSLEVAKKVRTATNLILMSGIRVGGGGMQASKNSPGISNNNQPTASELEQAIEQARKLEGIVDYVQIRIHEHPNAWVQDKEKPIAIAYAEAIKKAGIKVLTCPTAGFHDVIQNDGFIASGMADMIGMTTPFFADRELVRKVKEGRPDDIIPCIACWNCHGISMSKGPWYSTCTVNPTWGLPPYKLQGISAPGTSKKVVVIGGGPGGMKAALTAAERGHKVTLYEKSGSLGGLLKIADNTRWRWTFKDYKEWLIYQVKKNGIDVKLNAAATPEMIKAGKFDAVLVATGAEPVASKMKSDGSKVFNILEAYSKKDELGQNVVVVGAGKYGFEAALGMAKDGHKVTVLANGDRLFEADCQGPHNMQNQENIYQNHPNFSYALKSTVKSITGGKVVYTDSTGAEKSVQADSIVIWAGLKAKMDEAGKFLNSADEVYLLGDCTGKNGTLQKTIRSAFFTASQL